MTSRISEYTAGREQICRKNDKISPKLYEECGVKLGLRDENGNGVLTGLTNISKVVSSKIENGQKVPCDGELWYRGCPMEELIGSFGEYEMGFEKTAYLLLMGEWPSEDDYKEFCQVIGESRQLPVNFTRDVIMKKPGADIMNTMTRSILALASYDEMSMDVSIANCLRQCIQLIGQFPVLAAYSYNAYNYYVNQASMIIHIPDAALSTAENLLLMLRADQQYTQVEAKSLDTALILHMEHGGGNNSTFTTRVVTSSGSDTYSTIAAAMSSLKGPKHGGANIKVMEMMADIRAHVKDYADEEELAAYLSKILDGGAFDGKKLIYGMGHAIYTKSDPRERAFKRHVIELAQEKGRQQDLMLYEKVEKIAPALISSRRHVLKDVSPNVDFYSGFVYEMLGIPQELYTAIFAVARIVGWSAHRIEELICTDKIIRPAYMSVMEAHEYCKQK